MDLVLKSSDHYVISNDIATAQLVLELMLGHCVTFDDCELARVVSYGYGGSVKIETVPLSDEMKRQWNFPVHRDYPC
jgi:hypothetical protein